MQPSKSVLVLVADARPETRAGVRCPHFGPCGGCSFLDRPYEEELAQKEAAFRAAAEAQLDLADVLVEPVLAAREPLFYRTSLKVPFELRRGRPIAGLYRRGTHRVVDLHTCAIQHPLLVKLLVGARAAAEELRTPIYEERTHRGLLRHFLARVGVGPSGTWEALAGFVVRYERDRETQRLAERLFERFRKRGLVGVVENVNHNPGSPVLGQETRLLVGRDTLGEVHDGLALETSLTTFAQVNAAQASVLYGEVERLLAPVAGLSVLDLYAGYGPIALRLARGGARVHAVEYDARAVAEGRRAAEANGLAERMTFASGDAGRTFSARADGTRFDAAVVDPPRRGLSAPLIEQLRESEIPRLVIVSCFPETFLRDLELLSPAYALRVLRTVDLFPRTPHLEALALLERR